MDLFDISMEVHERMLHWPGSTTPVQGWDTRLDRSEESNASNWILGSHCGTHVEGPSHFFADGDDVSHIALDRLIGPSIVVEIPESAKAITREVVEALSLPRPAGRVLFKTSNSGHRLERTEFDPSYVAVTVSGAAALVEAGASLIGIDYIAIEVYGAEGFPAHRTLLGARVAILEGIDLRQVPPGRYVLYCLPLRLLGSEAAPARAVLVPLDAIGER
ncbi:cyclase family protein [Pseudolysinimonas yzui]|uniref:Kynurenine formamidase n=1 Tax=Pseudolysinimonas yzui TaxID=2708254 RepID=A0A8J3GTE2_9MICO|nr:cyclase family protein [Pseudolysinimonas yzui]GHF26476.1 cyclase [Pseudolysinimonas yzui]